MRVAAIQGRIVVPKKTTAEQEKRKVERELDRQLEDTFPASDPLKITRYPPKSQSDNGSRTEDAGD